MAPLSVGVFDGMRNSLLTVSCVGGVMVWLTALSVTDTFPMRFPVPRPKRREPCKMYSFSHGVRGTEGYRFGGLLCVVRGACLVQLFSDQLF
jgi:hypothetical protein